MAATLKSLDARVRNLESGMERLLAGHAPATAGPMSPARQAELSRMFRESLLEMGIDVRDRPFVHPEEIRRRMIEHGVRPEDCLATRGIRELHGESGGEP